MLTREETNRSYVFERAALEHGFVEAVAVYDDTMKDHKIRWMRLGMKTIDIRIHPYLRDAPAYVEDEIAKVLMDRIVDPMTEIKYTAGTQRWIEEHKPPTAAVQ